MHTKTGKRILFFLLLLAGMIPRAQADEPRWVALTFDDGPSQATQLLLDGLAQRQVRATFFLCGYRITEYPQQAAAIAEAGHELGVHGYSHRYLHQLAPEQIREEIVSTAALLAGLNGRGPTLLRPPGGLYRESVLTAAAEQELSVVLWSLDPEDWDPKQRKYTVSRVTENAKSGDIILLHDLSEENAHSALRCIDRLREKGFCFCTVSELAEKTGTGLVPGQIYRSFPFSVP